jgi:hypothetical protein
MVQLFSSLDGVFGKKVIPSPGTNIVAVTSRIGFFKLSLSSESWVIANQSSLAKKLLLIFIKEFCVPHSLDVWQNELIHSR